MTPRQRSMMQLVVDSDAYQKDLMIAFLEISNGIEGLPDPWVVPYDDDPRDFTVEFVEKNGRFIAYFHQEECYSFESYINGFQTEHTIDKKTIGDALMCFVQTYKACYQ